MDVEMTPSKSEFSRYLGLRLSPPSSGKVKILAVAENSPSDIKGVHIGDEILAINGKSVTSGLLKELGLGKTTLTVKHLGIENEITLDAKDEMNFPEVKLVMKKTTLAEESSLFNAWINKSK